MWLNSALVLPGAANKWEGVPWTPFENLLKLEGTPAEPALLLLPVKAYPTGPSKADRI